MKFELVVLVLAFTSKYLVKTACHLHYSVFRQCALDALEDMAKWFSEQDGEVAVSPSYCVTQICEFSGNVCG